MVEEEGARVVSLQKRSSRRPIAAKHSGFQQSALRRHRTLQPLSSEVQTILEWQPALNSGPHRPGINTTHIQLIKQCARHSCR